MAKCIQFKDREDDSTNHIGVVLDNGSLVCMCCGGVFELEEYEEIEDISWDEIWHVLDKWL